MHDARDAEDKRLLEAGEFTLLLESYYGVILDRCRARVRPEADAIGVAADVAIRLLSELKRGRRYRVPFRVVVHKVIGWKIQEHFEPPKLEDRARTAEEHAAAFNRQPSELASGWCRSRPSGTTRTSSGQ